MKRLDISMKMDIDESHYILSYKKCEWKLRMLYSLMTIIDLNLSDS